MKSDFSRATFNPAKHFSRVLQQQGKVTLDADGNEQVSILLHYLQTLAKDLIGPHAAPRDGGGFLLSNDGNGGINISAGRYYVDGILVENETLCSYHNQPDYVPGEDDPVAQEKITPGGDPVWLYLDVWERHISALEDDAIREKALGGADTCHRAKVLWQVKAKRLENARGTPEQQAQRAMLMAQKAELERLLKEYGVAVAEGDNLPSSAPVNSVSPAARSAAARASESTRLASAATVTVPGRTPTPSSTPTNPPPGTPAPTPTPTPEPIQVAQILADLEAVKQQLAALDAALPSLCQLGMQSLLPISSASMAARIDPGPQNSGPCLIAPDAKYRGAENHLYRIEIHQCGVEGQASFKWSRENGSIATQWLGTEGLDIIVASSRGFAAGDWIELSHDAKDLNGLSGVMAKLAKVEAGVLTVDADSIQTASGDGKVAELLAWNTQLGHPKVRRWDQRENDVQKLKNGAVAIIESGENTPIWMNLEDGVQVLFTGGGTYKVGDYWLVAVRVGSDQIDNWPMQGNEPLAIAASGVQHHYAPLGVAQWTENAWDNGQLQLCYCQFDQLASCPDEDSVSVS